MDKHINDHLQQCVKCQKTKKEKRATTNFVSPLPQYTMPNQRIHMDLFGPLKTFQSGKQYIMVVTDAFTKYLELIAIPDKQGETVATALFTKWLCRQLKSCQTVKKSAMKLWIKCHKISISFTNKCTSRGVQ